MATIFEWDGSGISDRHGGGVGWDDALDTQTPSALGINPSIGGWSTYGMGQQVGTEQSKIMTASSYLPGKMGWRAYYGNGQNNNTCTIGITFLSGNDHRSEFWVRYYMRWQTGFEWTLPDGPGYWKILREWSGGWIVGLGYQGTGNASIAKFEKDTGPWGQEDFDLPPTFDWVDMNGGSTGDGQWHCHEWHFKKNSGVGVSDGVLEFYFDGQYRSGLTNLNFDSTSFEWKGFIFLDNQDGIANGPWYTDFAEIKIVDSGGPIGPIGGTQTVGDVVIYL